MTILSKIMEGVRADLEVRKAACPQPVVETEAARRSPARDFAASLRGEGVGLIAEVKLASPSRGVIRADLDAAAVARTYVTSGADAISVLTESRWFGGSLSSLDDVVDVVGSDGPPVLRKDFIVDSYQVLESRAHGADCILLIAALLNQAQLSHMLHQSELLGMSCVVEVHDELELARVVDSGALIIGINSRDLRTLEVNMATFERLRPLIPAGRLVVGESGIRRREDVERLATAGVDAVLIGEAIISAPDIDAKMKELRCNV